MQTTKMEKLTQQEQERIKFIQDGFINTLFELGKINFDLDNIKNQLNSKKQDLLSTLYNLSEQEKEFISELTNKYGSDKNINLETYEIK